MKWNDWKKQAAEEYRETPIPAELPERVRRGVEEGERRRAKKPYRPAQAVLALAAACCTVFVAGLNVSPAFAQAAANLPVLGGVARVFTFRTYAWQSETAQITVQAPAVDGTGHPETEKEVNAEIQALIDGAVAEVQAQADAGAQAYEEAFGSVPETGRHAVDIRYEVKCSNGEALSFVVTRADVMASANVVQYFYNIDLETGERLTLADVLGPDWKETADESIRAQMAEREAAGEADYFEGDLGFTGVTEDTGFYLDENGDPVVSFDKYTIAPGAYGVQEFPIAR